MEGTTTVGAVPVIDAHVTLGVNRDVQLSAETLLTTMGRCGVDVALVAPAERFVAVSNEEGNRFVAAAARASGGRLLPYATASPWLGARALDILREAADLGARALALDPALQGFDLLDGQIDDLVRFAAARRWPVYIRTGTPPWALPLSLAALARRHPDAAFILGRNGATDFWLDVEPALLSAPNLYANTATTFWDNNLLPLVRNPHIGAGRIIYSSDAPFAASLAEELANVRALPSSETDHARILGGTISHLLDQAID